MGTGLNRILEALEAAKGAVDPTSTILNSVRFDGKKVEVGRALFPFKRIFVMGFGKASGEMAAALEQVLPVEDGVVVGLKNSASLKRVRFIESTHPLLSEKSVFAAKELMGFAVSCGPSDLVFCVVSGGGSSLAELPRVPLEDARRISEALLKCGASINEFNVVRRHLSRFKGGFLAEACKARIVNLVVSDVLDGNLSAIASGPTVPDKTTVLEAKRVLEKYGLSKYAPFLVETPKRDFPHVYSKILVSNWVAVDAAANKLPGTQKIYGVEGDVSAVARRFAALLDSGVSFVGGGEPTVVVKGNGRGGRCQELALRVAMLAKKPFVFAAYATDGKDGNSDFAGGWVDDEAVVKSGLDVKALLADNNSELFFKTTKQGFPSRPTGTNVADIFVGLPA